MYRLSLNIGFICTGHKTGKTNWANLSFRHGRDRMVFGFTTICAISVYHH